MSLAEITQWIQKSALAVSIQDAAYAYPLIEGAHVLSLALSVGMILWFDLRLIGVVLPGNSIKAMYATLRPWLITGFVMMVITGSLLFVNRAADVWANTYFRLKLVLLALSLINILIYHFIIERGSATWDTSDVPPRQARIAGAISLLLWFSVIAVGRLMAYSL